MTLDEFIAEHVRICRAGRARQYDPKKRKVTYHTLEYSRRKCAKKLWRRQQLQQEVGAA